MSEPVDTAHTTGGVSRVWALHEVCVLLEAPPEILLELVEFRVGTSARLPAPEEFDREWLGWLARSFRLHRDLGVDALAAAFLCDLIEENAALARRVRLLERLAVRVGDRVQD
jgi:hypothetical protein